MYKQNTKKIVTLCVIVAVICLILITIMIVQMGRIDLLNEQNKTDFAAQESSLQVIIDEQNDKLSQKNSVIQSQKQEKSKLESELSSIESALKAYETTTSK